MRFILASSNKGKLKEFQKAFTPTPFELISAEEAGLNTFPDETGQSYEENALLKAHYAASTSGLYALADDSGLEVESLGGEPGLYSARYGDKETAQERLYHVLRKLESFPEGERGARFVCNLVLAKPDGSFKSFWGECSGEITAVPHGKDGFGYDPIFFSHDLYKTFAEASQEEKAQVSHRDKALKALFVWLETDEAKEFLSG